MKILKYALILILSIAIVSGVIITSIGYSAYKNAIAEKPINDTIAKIQEMKNYMTVNDLPETYKNAVIAIEDHRFYQHGAIDITSIGRAIYSNVTNFKLGEGGSTITQQVAKNIFLSQEQTITRKVAEIFVAFDLEKNYSKDDILELYVNTSYFGSGYYGIYAASMGYFNKKPKDLTLEECALLAGIPNAPSVYSLNANPDLAKQRAQTVLDAMKKYGYLGE
ncbi:MAG: transglycosylase domain-containing protein [Oscillospiraceae bacterium]|nr:transglycosylase domain-containing protein [Oscillospiraceae bacterium]